MNQQSNSKQKGNSQMGIVSNIVTPQQNVPIYYPVVFPQYHYGQTFIYSFQNQPNNDYNYLGQQPMPMYVYNQQPLPSQNISYVYPPNCLNYQIGHQNQIQNQSNYPYDTNNLGYNIHNQNSNDVHTKNEEITSQIKIDAKIPISQDNITTKYEFEEKQIYENKNKQGKSMEKNGKNIPVNIIKKEESDLKVNCFNQKAEQCVITFNQTKNLKKGKIQIYDSSENQNSHRIEDKDEDNDDYNIDHYLNKDNYNEQSTNMSDKKNKTKNYNIQQQIFNLDSEEYEDFLERISPENDIIVSDIQNINVQNCFRNILKALQIYVNNNYNYIYEYENQAHEKLNGKNLVNLPIVKIEKPKQYNKKMFFQKFNKFIKSKKYNCQSIKQLVNNKLYSTLLGDFLNIYADTWIKDCTSSKIENQKLVQYLKICCQNNLYLCFLHRNNFQYFKQKQNNKVQNNKQNLQQQQDKSQIFQEIQFDNKDKDIHEEKYYAQSMEKK